MWLGAGGASARSTGQAPHQQFKEGELKLESGAVIQDFSISRVTHGSLNAAKSNAVLMVSAVGGNHHRLDFMIGPGKALDPDRYFIIATDAIANGLSTSPSNAVAQPRMAFPRFGIRDLLHSQYRLLKEKFGIDHLVAVVGPSMGGMQTLLWGVSHPDVMDGLVAARRRPACSRTARRRAGCRAARPLRCGAVCSWHHRAQSRWCLGGRALKSMHRTWWLLLFAACGLALSGCGGGGGGANSAGDSPPATSSPPVATTPPVAGVPPVVATAASAATPSVATGLPLITLTSDAGDQIGGGSSYQYDTTNAAIRVSVLGSRLNVRVDGRESWTGDFQLSGNASQLQAGTSTGLTRYPFQSPGAGALAWSGQGRGCNVLTGSVTVLSATYQAGVLSTLDMSFEQHCEGVGPALRGRITIGAGAMAQVTVPQNPLPDQPVVDLKSDVGDYIGAGSIYAYDSRNSILTITSQGKQLSVSIRGDQQWSAEFVLPGSGTALVPGTYTGLTRQPFQTPGAGGLSWSGEGRGCNTLTGAVVINSVRYDLGILAAIDMTFEQHCEGAAAALRGTIRWDATTPVAAPAPTNPAPVGLWNSPDGVIPATGNAMYLASAQGDAIGQGWTWWVGAATGAPTGTGTTLGSAKVTVSESNGLLMVKLTGDVTWAGEFKAMDALKRVQPGYYGIVHRFPFQNPARGGMNWSMDGRGCNVLSGWFMVDSISYVGDQLQAVDLRFSQQCEGAVAPLRGRIRWTLTGVSN